VQAISSYRVGGTIGYTNDLAKYLSFFFPIIISLLFIKLKRFEKLFYVFTLAIMSVAIVVTLSRAAWIGVMLSAAIVFIFQSKYQRVNFYYPAFALLLILIITATQSDLIKQRLISDDVGSKWSRITTSKVALKVIGDYPLLGVGANNYEEIVEKYADPLNPETFRMAVHNAYLLSIAENGILGFFVFCWLYMKISKTLNQSTRGTSDLWRSFGIGAFGAYIFYLLQGVVEFGVKNNEPRFYLFWLIISLAAVAQMQLIEKKHEILCK